MIKDDKLYQILLKNNFDLYRGEKSVAEYIKLKNISLIFCVSTH